MVGKQEARKDKIGGKKVNAMEKLKQYMRVSRKYYVRLKKQDEIITKYTSLYHIQKDYLARLRRYQKKQLQKHKYKSQREFQSLLLAPEDSNSSTDMDSSELSEMVKKIKRHQGSEKRVIDQLKRLKLGQFDDEEDEPLLKRGGRGNEEGSVINLSEDSLMKDNLGPEPKIEGVFSKEQDKEDFGAD